MTPPGHGAYRHLHWDVVLSGDVTSLGLQLVSLHELFHADLDVTTDYGSLLCVYAHLSEVLGHDSPHGRVFRNCLAECRQVHETYATFASALTIADSGFDDWADLPVREYAAYMDLGKELCGPFRGRFFRFHAALAALRLCMQAPVTDIVLGCGLENFRFRDLPAAMLPDRRLWSIRRIVARPDFWLETLAKIRALHPDHPTWAQAMATEETDQELTQLFGSAPDGLNSVLLSGFHDALAESLRAAGIPSLPYDGHTRNAGAMVIACEAATAGKTDSAFRLRLATDTEPLAGAASNLERERLVLRTEPRRAGVWHSGLETYLKHHPLENGEPRLYMVIVRWPRRLVAQYRFGPEDREAILKDSNRPKVLLQRLTTDDHGEVVLFVPLDGPAELVTLAALENCFTNVSSAALSSGWWDDWGDAVLENSNLTALLDVSPFVALRRWMEGGGNCLRFGRVDLEGESAHYTAFWLQGGIDGDYGMQYLAPSTLVLATTLEVYIERLAKDHSIQVEKISLRGDALAGIEPVLQYLFQLDASFDFGAGAEQHAGR